MMATTCTDIAETAMCLWEYFLEDEPKNYLEYREENGACDTRMHVLSWAEACDAAWKHAVETRGYDEPFDWHFVPTWCNRCLSDDFELITSDPAQAVVLMLGEA